MIDHREQAVRDIVACTLAHHPTDCVFVPNAEEVIVQRVIRATALHGWGKEAILDACEQAFLDAEIHCPHRDG